MNHKILTIAADDIIINSDNVSSRIDKACSGVIKMYVSGMLFHSDTLFITLEHVREYKFYKHVLVSFLSIDQDEICSELSSRVFYGFSFVGGFELQNQLFGLFRFLPEVSSYGNECNLL